MSSPAGLKKALDLTSYGVRPSIFVRIMKMGRKPTLSRTTITSKGQVTVPVDVRRQLDLRPGDELVFEIRGQELCVRGLKHRKLSDLRGSLAAARAFPGRDVIREEVGLRLGQDLSGASGAPNGRSGTDNR